MGIKRRLECPFFIPVDLPKNRSVIKGVTSYTLDLFTTAPIWISVCVPIGCGLGLARICRYLDIGKHLQFWEGRELMEPENNILTLLKRFRYLILAAMVIASLVNAFVRFAGAWSHLWGVLTVHAWFIQAVFAYLRGGWISIGPGGLSKDANPFGRAALAATAFAFYLLTFAYEVDNRSNSISERRASDWTKPTREEIGHRTE